MRLTSGVGGVVWAVLVAVAVVAVAVVTLHVQEDRNVVANSVASSAVRKQPEGLRPPDASQPQEIAPTLSVPITPEDEAALSTLVDSEISQLHEGVTLAQWMDLRGQNEGWEASKSEEFSDCRSLTKIEALASGRQITRTVYFDLPKAPTPAVLPTLIGEELVKSACTLYMVRIQTPTPSREDGHTLEQALQQHFVEKYGSSLGTEGTQYQRTVDAGRWKAGFLEIFSVHDPHHAGDAPNDLSADSVFASARLTVAAEIEQDHVYGQMKAYRYRSIENAQFHRVIAIAAVDDSLTERVTKLYDALFAASASSVRAKQPESTKLRDSVVPMLGMWINAAKSLPPSRRAASLYVAHRLLSAAEDVSMISGGWNELWGKDKTELRAILGKLGAKYEYAELGGIYEYSNNWLEEARELDPNGPVGEMDVLDALARGRAPQIGKDQQADIFHTVIADGEWLLARNPDAATAAQIHFIIGDAYADMVALADGGEPDYGESFSKEEGNAARVKALEHYRAGLVVDGVSENAKDAWLQAWNISAGLMPTTRYIYIDD
jgi:hypothetical protein